MSNRWVAASDSERKVRLWEIDGPPEPRTFEFEGKLEVINLTDRSLVLWYPYGVYVLELPPGPGASPPFAFSGRGLGPFGSVRVSRNHEWMLAGSLESKWRVVALARDKVTAQPVDLDGLNPQAISNDGRWVLCGWGDTSSLVRLDPQGRCTRISLKGMPPAKPDTLDGTPMFSPNGRALIATVRGAQAGGADGRPIRFLIWDLTEEPTPPLREVRFAGTPSDLRAALDYGLTYHGVPLAVASGSETWVASKDASGDVIVKRFSDAPAGVAQGPPAGAVVANDDRGRVRSSRKSASSDHLSRIRPLYDSLAAAG